MASGEWRTTNYSPPTPTSGATTHSPLAGDGGGFDVMLGNPPWEVRIYQRRSTSQREFTRDRGTRRQRTETR